MLDDDDQREQQLRHAVVGARQVARVERQRPSARSLDDDVGRLVGRARRAAAVGCSPYIAPDARRYAARVRPLAARSTRGPLAPPPRARAPWTGRSACCCCPRTLEQFILRDQAAGPAAVRRRRRRGARARALRGARAAAGGRRATPSPRARRGACGFRARRASSRSSTRSSTRWPARSSRRNPAASCGTGAGTATSAPRRRAARDRARLEELHEPGRRALEPDLRGLRGARAPGARGRPRGHARAAGRRLLPRARPRGASTVAVSLGAPRPSGRLGAAARGRRAHGRPARRCCWSAPGTRTSCAATRTSRPAAPRPNLLWLGARSDEEAARLILCADVGIVPFERHPFNDAGLPYRILKYARLGRRTIAPDLAGAQTWERAVTAAPDADAWVAALREAAGARARPDRELREWALAQRAAQPERPAVAASARAGDHRLARWASCSALRRPARAPAGCGSAG